MPYKHWDRSHHTSIYKATEDRDVWEHAEAFALERGRPLSRVVAEALRRYLKTEDPR